MKKMFANVMSAGPTLTNSHMESVYTQLHRFIANFFS